MDSWWTWQNKVINLYYQKKNVKLSELIFLEKIKDFFIKQLKDIMNYQHFTNLNLLIKKVLLDIKKEKDDNTHKIILFSPSAASFDNFKNFEERGRIF